MCQQLGWLVNLEKSELEPKQDFNFVGYQFDLRFDPVRLTPDRWQNLQEKMLKLLSLPACPVREFRSVIGLLTATEKQVHVGQLHMKLIQWHHKQLEGPRITGKGDPNPQVLAPPFTMMAEGRQCTYSPTITPNKHALQIITDASIEGWGTRLDEHFARATWSPPGSKLHINYLELKAAFLALKEFQDLCSTR